jgi:hypothetical protein
MSGGEAVKSATSAIDYKVVSRTDIDPDNLPDADCLREALLDWSKYGKQVRGVWLFKGECNYGLWRVSEADGKFVLKVSVWYYPPKGKSHEVQSLIVEVTL